MLQTLKKRIQKMFTCADQPNTYGSALEAYIVSKRPTSAADVEYYTQEFDRKQSHRSIWGVNYGQ